MRLAPHVLAIALLFPAAAPAAAPASTLAPARPGMTPLKHAQATLLALEPMRERAEGREFAGRARQLRRLAQRLRVGGKSTLRAAGQRARPQIVDEDVRSGLRAPVGRAVTAAPIMDAAITNVRCNDPSGDLATNEGQSETTIACWHDYMLAAWNDGKGWDDGTSQTQGWATSVDGGATWIDRGTFPLPAAYATTWKWTSDPVLAVNSTTGAFYFAALGEVGTTQSAIGVLKGRFTGSTFAWQAPSAVRVVNASTNFLDKEWIAVDPADGRVYLTYSDFHPYSDVYFQWADSALAAWSAVRKISTTSEYGWVQGSRPVVGAGNDVYVVYYLIGAVDTDSYRLCRSSDRGVTFAPPADALTFYPNFGSGAPGFNRAMGVQFPSIAVDHSGGPHAGRIYMGWAESLNWFDDWNFVGNSGTRTESEPNDTTTTATSVTAGQVIHGTLNSTNNFDYYAVSLTAGQTLIVDCDSMTAGSAFTLRLFARDGTTRLAYCLPAASQPLSTSPPLYGVWIASAPTTGTYYIRVAQTAGAGRYRLNTGLATRISERGRDQRDVFVSWSDNNGTAWSTPVRINKEAVGFDDWLPEVAIAPDGQIAAAWYDWRDAPVLTCGGVSNVYMATSDDGGTTWTEALVSSAASDWTNVATNIMPNQGDYIALSSVSEGVGVCWADGRDGNPNAYLGWVPSDRPVISSIVPDPCFVTLHWFMSRAPGTTAAVYRQGAASSTWDSLATITLDATHHFAYTDNAVAQGGPFKYLLGVTTSGVEHLSPYVTVPLSAPAPPALQSADVSEPCSVTLTWLSNRTPGITAAVYRQSLPSTTWDSLATITLDGAHHFTYTDNTVTQSASYAYLLGVTACGLETLSPPSTVAVPVAAQPAFVSASATGSSIRVEWSLLRNAGTPAKLYRRSATSAVWGPTPIATLNVTSAQRLRYTDTAVQADSSYEYRLGVLTCGTEVFTAPRLVHVPVAELAIQNNAAGRGEETVIAYSLRSPKGTLAILDLSGRVVFSTTVTGSSFALKDAGRIRPGIYMVRLTQAGHSVTKRLVVL